jgi:hypothetical protein
MVIESLLGSVVLPAAIDMLKGMGGAVSRKWFGLSIDDQIKLQHADVEKLKALAELDNPHGTPSQWVIDLRASFRYIGAAIVILVGCGVLYAGFSKASSEAVQMGFSLVGMPFGFIFGERMLLGMKGGNQK